MSSERVALVLAVALAVVAVGKLALGEGDKGKTVTWNLHRANDDGLKLSHIRYRDRLRHGRITQQKLLGKVDFDLEGAGDPYGSGIYYTRVKLGTPPKEFHVQIDTGSDVLWVNCKPCDGCPKSSRLKIKLEVFDPSSSSTASRISCSDKICTDGAKTSQTVCLHDKNKCGYTFQFADGGETSGYYVSDVMHFDTSVGNSSRSIVFGCSTSQAGPFADSGRAVDGLFGFGLQRLSVISQLSAKKVAPAIFSHCLKGGNQGGGILVLGQVMEPNIVYTPLIPKQQNYNVNLLGISVNEQKLPIDPKVFDTADSKGIMIDSGTTLAYIAKEAYDLLVTAITQSVSKTADHYISQGMQCYLTNSSDTKVFPLVTLKFAGGAIMILKPENYLVKANDDYPLWCMGIQKSDAKKGMVLGDIVLKDKLVVYDLDGQRIGWANYNCSLPIKVSQGTSNNGTIGNDDNAQLHNENELDIHMHNRAQIIHRVLLHAQLHESGGIKNKKKAVSNKNKFEFQVQD